ncbi:hypothetical protein [Streptomyces zagrosensis]|uniref:Uncharacterized protein n=1 Tax=Streptomyces zagrosensis TaxID=1042984 RepID=A0A7W9QCI1_9ACTN|nr:hypothetical protein [Streptomyces zagrosensis]MBB5937596.1 hypothetical protein [Streptomyces zagrosensis]
MRDSAESEAKQQNKRLELCVAQVAGSALAAVAAAVLASRLGVYGTIIGAGVVSVVATAGGSLFQHAFRRTGEQLREVTVQNRPRARQVPVIDDGRGVFSSATSRAAANADGQDASAHSSARASARASARNGAGGGTHGQPRLADTRALSWPDASRTRPLRQVDDATRMLRRPMLPAEGHGAEGGDEAREAQGAYAAPGAHSSPPGARSDEFTGATMYGTRLRGWRRPALGALAVFVLAMAFITGVEWVSGGPVSNVWGDDKGGTTVSHSVSRGSGSHSAPDDAPGSEQSPSEDDPGQSGGPSGSPAPNGKRPGGGAAEPTPTPTGSAPAGGGAERRTPAPTPSTPSQPTTPAQPSTPSLPGGSEPATPGTGGEADDGTRPGSKASGAGGSSANTQDGGPRSSDSSRQRGQREGSGQSDE